MSAYVIGINERTIQDEAWKSYLEKAKETFPLHAKALAKFGGVAAPEGNAVEGVAIFEFATFDDAMDWYHSDAYQKAVQQRLGAAVFKIYIVEGL